jgi:hypothetical protein
VDVLNITAERIVRGQPSRVTVSGRTSALDSLTRALLYARGDAGLVVGITSAIDGEGK